MFGELPKLFDRNFAMAFFLPTTVFVGMSAEIANRFGRGMGAVAFFQSNLIIGTTLLLITAWLGSIFLLVTNSGLYRFLEGYGEWNPLRILRGLEVRRYKKLQDEISQLDKNLRKLRDSFPQKDRAKRTKLVLERSVRFPDSEDLLLPTSFGNTLRAFEIYSRVMYGIESIGGWSRLLAVVPKDYRELMDNSRTEVDFWVNVGFLGMLLSLEYASFAIYTMSIPVLWIFAVVILLAVVAPHFARESAQRWGDYVKAAFDVFSPQLRESLGIEVPQSRAEEKQQWMKFSQAIVFRVPNVMPELKKTAGRKTKYRSGDSS